MLRLLLAVALFAATSAQAQDDLDDLPESEFGNEQDAEPVSAPRVPVEDDGAEDGEPDELDEELLEPDGSEPDFADDEDDELFDDEAVTGPRAVGEDTADEYRRKLAELKDADAEEKLNGWEEYLELYPKSSFREQISREISAAERELYGEKITTEVAETVDRRLIRFPETALLENLNPATRLRAGFEMGLPEWISLIADFEYAFGTQFSAHASMRKRYTGWSLELGPRVALIKAPDPGLILTLAPDLQLGIDPSLIGLRPNLLAGWEPVDKLFFQVQGSPSWELFEGGWGMRLRLGGNVTFRAADPVAMFIEGATESKYIGWSGGDFQFHTVSFGMRFYPNNKNAKNKDNAEVIAAANVPVWLNYWRFHEGAASVQGLYYLE